MYCVIKCYVRGNQARVKNADLRHPSCTVVMYRRKSASPVLNVLKCGKVVKYCVFRSTIQEVNIYQNFLCQVS